MSLLRHAHRIVTPRWLDSLGLFRYTPRFPRGRGLAARTTHPLRSADLAIVRR